jgi:hypothetical protein
VRDRGVRERDLHQLHGRELSGWVLLRIDLLPAFGIHLWYGGGGVRGLRRRQGRYLLDAGRLSLRGRGALSGRPAMHERSMCLRRRLLSERLLPRRHLQRAVADNLRKRRKRMHHL